MQTTTPQFRQSLAQSHQRVTTVDAYYAGALTRSALPVADGAVTLDRGSTVRRTLSLTISDVALLPWEASDPLAVYGQTLTVATGIRYGNGAEELVPLGTFRIDEPEANVYAGPITLTGKSLECAIQDDNFLAPATTRGYSTCVDAITGFIQQTIPAAVVVNQTSDNRNPACAVSTWDAQASRWEAVTQIATAMHAEIYVDALGRFVIRDFPNPLTDPVVWDIAEGEGGTLMSAARKMSRASVCNAVVVSGENASSNTAPVSAVAYDDEPTSPTRWTGPYGHVPKFYSSSLLTTVGACQAVADSMLFDAIAPNIQTSITALPNPALEAGDCVRVAYAGRKELFIVQSVSIPLTIAGSYSLTLRGGKEDA
jgi:hypothetical protein